MSFRKTSRSGMTLVELLAALGLFAMALVLFSLAEVTARRTTSLHVAQLDMASDAVRLRRQLREDLQVASRIERLEWPDATASPAVETPAVENPAAEGEGEGAAPKAAEPVPFLRLELAAIDAAGNPQAGVDVVEYRVLVGEPVAARSDERLHELTRTIVPAEGSARPAVTERLTRHLLSLDVSDAAPRIRAHFVLQPPQARARVAAESHVVLARRLPARSQ